jgi:TatD DNase family protein
MLVDAHAHLDRYGDLLPEALAQIERHRILTVAVAMDVESYQRSLVLARGSPYIKPTFGIHPWQAPRYCERLGELDQYLQQTPLIGEAGLDFHWVEDRDTYPCQRTVFEHQCDWARRLGKVMNLHTKGAEREVLDALRQFKLSKSIIHWYSGPTALIEAYLAAGAFFTIGVEVLMSAAIHEIARIVPVERLLVETDNPGGWEWLSGSQGMPEIILRVRDKVAELKAMDSGELEAKLAANWGMLAGGG